MGRDRGGVGVGGPGLVWGRVGVWYDRVRVRWVRVG